MRVDYFKVARMRDPSLGLSGYFRVAQMRDHSVGLIAQGCTKLSGLALGERHTSRGPDSAGAEALRSFIVAKREKAGLRQVDVARRGDQAPRPRRDMT